MPALADLTEDEKYLVAILQDQSGIDIAEFCWTDENQPDNIFRCWDFQYPWYRVNDKFQIDQCFPAGSLVLTARGQVPIEQVQPGDLVLTHERRWKPVLEVVDRGEQDFVRLGGYGHPGLTVTPDHEFYVRRYRRRRKVELAPAEWRPAGQLTTVDAEDHYKWATPTEVEPLPLPPIPVRYRPGRSNDLREEHLDSIYFWWLVGLYCAEGSVSSSYGHGGKVNRVTFSVHVDELDVVRHHLELLGFRYRGWTNGSVVNVVVGSLTLAQYMAELGGKGAANKRLHPAVHGLTRKARNALFDGLMFGDGHFRDGRHEYSTVSRALAFDVRMLSLGLDGQASVSIDRRAATCVIQGRTVNQRPKYTVSASWPETNHRVTFSEGHAWARVSGLQETVERGRAYDLRVADDHSYVVESIVVHNCGRSLGKSLGIQMRAFAFPFTNPQSEMLITAPELIHLDPVTGLIETRIMAIRLGWEFLKRGAGATGFKHRPFEANFRNGAKIVGRIPQKDGKGVKGQHPKRLEQDESQDYPEPGWVELTETLKYGDPTAVWRAHGVSRGVRDRYYKQTQKESGWFVHRWTAMHRPDWTAEERAAKAELYGTRDHPDYRRNILGQHGDAQSTLFVLSRLMECVDQRQDSWYNREEFKHIRINDERLREMGAGYPIEELLDLPTAHQAYSRTWVGMDVGMTNHPSEIIVLGEAQRESSGGKRPDGVPNMVLRTLLRVHLERISSRGQRAIMAAIAEYYRPQAFAMDRTGLGLPIWSEIMEGDSPVLARAMRAYNFSEKITIGYDRDDDDEYDPEKPLGEPIMANVLEYASDMARVLVDSKAILLPWDIDMLREFQGQTYVVNKSNTDAYGKKKFNVGKFHTLDAFRMAVLGYYQEHIDALKEITEWEPVLDSFLPV